MQRVLSAIQAGGTAALEQFSSSSKLRDGGNGGLGTNERELGDRLILSSPVA